MDKKGCFQEIMYNYSNLLPYKKRVVGAMWGRSGSGRLEAGRDLLNGGGSWMLHG